MSVTEHYTGNGNVYLLRGAGKIFADVAARITRSERPADLTACCAYDGELIRKVAKRGHLSTLEFDWFVFAVDGYSRVCEAQLVRKRMASFMIKSGREELNGKREYSVVLPESVADFVAPVRLTRSIVVEVSGRDLVRLMSEWYEAGVNKGLPEEDLRYFKPQATEFRGLIGMNAHALHDFFAVRCCNKAQAEIRDMAWKMLRQCREVAPDLFQEAGPNCKRLGYCPENEGQCEEFKGKIPTKNEAMEILGRARSVGAAEE